MTVLLVTTHLWVGGVTTYVLTLARGLQARGCCPIVASAGGDGERRLAETGIRHVRVPVGTKQVLHPKLAVAVLQLCREVQQRRVALLHTQTRVTGVVGRAVAACCDIPMVATVHGWFRPRFGRRVLPVWGDQVIAVSEAVRGHVIGDLGADPHRVTVIRHGIEVPPPAERVAEAAACLRRGWGWPSAPVVGFLGRLSSVKGVGDFLEAVRLVLFRRPEARAVVVGDGPDRQALERLAGRLGLGPRVRFTGATWEPYAALAAMDCVVCPSRQEGLGFTVLEALAVARPIVVTGIGGVREVVEDGATGLLVPPGDRGQLVQAILRVLEDASGSAAMARAGRARVATEFTVDRMVDETVRVYSMAVAQGRTRGGPSLRPRKPELDPVPLGI